MGKSIFVIKFGNSSWVVLDAYLVADKFKNGVRKQCKIKLSTQRIFAEYVHKELQMD